MQRLPFNAKGLFLIMKGATLLGLSFVNERSLNLHSCFDRWSFEPVVIGLAEGTEPASFIRAFNEPFVIRRIKSYLWNINVYFI